MQNQYVKDYISENGDVIKYNKKPQTLLVDFNPNRMFIMQETKSLIYNVNTENNGNDKLKERLENELNISPIIVFDSNKLKQITAIDIMNYVSNYSNSRSVLDESNDLPVDFKLLNINEIREIILKQAELGSKGGLKLTNTDDDTDDFEELSFDFDDEVENKDNSFQNNSSASNSDNNDLKKIIVNKFKTYYVRILFYSFLSSSKLHSLKNIIDTCDDINNKRILNNLELEINILKLIHKNINPFVLSQLDYKIQNINKLSNDETLDKIDRALVAINKFDKLSDSEIVTPNKICKQMISMISDSNIVKLVTSGSKILDIASKEGEFTIAFYSKLKQLKISEELINNCLYSIPTSKIAYEFTRKVYEILNLNVDNIATSFTSYNLLDIKKGNNLDLNRIKRYILQNKKMSEIVLEDNLFYKEGDGEMQFDIVVGNPPYQEADGGAGASARPIYSDFVNISRSIANKYISLIIPSRWYVGGKGLDEFRVSMLNDSNIKEINDCLTPEDIFPNTNNRGGVCYLLWDKEYNNKEKMVRVISHKNNNIISDMYRNIKLFDEDVFIRDNYAESILLKIKENEFFRSFSDLVSSRKPFGLDGNFARSKNLVDDKSKTNNIKCYIKGKNIKFTNAKNILNHNEWVNNWKVFIPRANNIGTELNDDNMNSFVGEPNDICTESYLVIGGNLDMTEKEANNLSKYLKTKFLRYLHSLLKSSQDATSKTFEYVPIQDVSESSDIDWSKSIKDIDQQLYSKYGLTCEEIKHIEKSIKEM